jgi:hypothetical protein
MKRRLKRSTRQHIILSGICVIICSGVFLIGYFTVISNMKKNYESEIKVLSNQLAINKVYVYQAKEDIAAGSKVTKDMLIHTQVLSEQDRDNFITGKEIGKIALIDIQSGTEVLKSMLAEDISDNTVREAEFNSFLLSSNLKENDFVDVRILYPNGESYIVLSKKPLRNLSMERNNCFMWLTPEELLRVSGAIVDCYLNKGSKLYTVKYIEPRIQEASIITYTPNTDVLKLIKEDPNVVQTASDRLYENVRIELENRLSEFYNNNSEVSWDQYSYLTPDNNSGAEPDNIYNTQTGNTESKDYQKEANSVDNTTEKANGEKEEDIYYID